MKVPQIVDSTGLSADYWNEYFAKTIFFEVMGLSGVAIKFKEYPVRKYEQKFSPGKYENVVTPENKARVERLNELSDLVNKTFIAVSTFTELDFKRTINEVHHLIYGSGENYFYTLIS